MDEARARYEELFGTQTDEAWADIVLGAQGEDGEVDWDAFVANLVAPPSGDEGSSDDAGAENGAGEDDAASDDAGADGAGSEEDTMQVTASLLARIDEQDQRLAQLTAIVEAQHDRLSAAEGASARGMIAASVFPVADGRGGTAAHRFASSAVAVIANLRQNPGEESLRALLDHVAENGGRFCLAPVGMVAASLTSTGPGPSDDDKFLAEKWPNDPESVEGVRAVMAELSVGAREAHSIYCRRKSGQA